jgi:hypothetical protein
MASRIALIASALFWVLMNGLLWQAEWGDRFTSGSELSPDLIWQKILDSPDSSVLSIRHQGRTLGSLEWHPSILEASRSNGTAIEGMVSAPVGHLIRVSTRFHGSDSPLDRLMILGTVELSPSNTWEKLQARVDHRPKSWEIHAEAGSDQIRMIYEAGRQRFEQTFETRNRAALQLMLAPYLTALPAGLIPDNILSRPDSLTRSVSIEARSDWMQIGRSRVRVYRLSARLPGQLEATAFISRAGELLKIQLPDRLQLVNDAIVGR